jgi:dihydropteroate synthase type 2
MQPRGIAVGETTDAETVWESLLRFFEERIDVLLRQGVSLDRLIIDPGLGFFLGRAPQPSFLVLSRIDRLKQRFPVPVLISASRKSFLRMLTGRSIDQIGSATLAAELYAASRGADYVRTHDVGSLSDGLDVLEALTDVEVRYSALPSGSLS